MMSIVEDVNSSYSPSFSSYFNPQLSDVVTRVTTELSSSDDDDGGFEFNLSDLVPDARHVYPMFDHDLVLASDCNLVVQDTDGDSRSSSSEEMLCFWISRKSNSGSSEKSQSTGSSATEKVKFWKLRDLLKRSKSEGKDEGREMLLTAKKKTAAREIKKRRTYLPYRQSLFGMFVAPPAMAKTHIRRYT